ncbi:hypothetical protein KUCAC02_009502, partial [Chaenocephalus aceratus]
MDKRKRLMNVQEALALRNHLSEEESDGKPPQKVRPSYPDPPREDGPTDVPAHAEVCTTEPSPAQEIRKDGTCLPVPCGGHRETADTEHPHGWGNAFFNATLSRNRFRDIMRYLRFDKKETRRCRLATDKFPHVRK